MKHLKTWLGLALAPLLAACSSVSLLNSTIPRSGYSVTKNVVYGDESRQALDIYVPDSLTAPAPVVLFFYGGSWKSGSKEDYLFVGQALASKGFVTVIADYRLYPEVMFPAFIEDSAKAAVFVHRHIAQYGGDPGALFVAGHSAGAYNALMLAMNGGYLRKAGGSIAWLRGAIGLAGPYDFLPITGEDIKPIFAVADQALTQPITFAGLYAPPVLLLTGDADEEVSVKNTRNLAQKLTGLKREAEAHIYPGVGHVGIVLSLARGFRSKTSALEDISAFIRRHTHSARRT